MATGQEVDPKIPLQCEITSRDGTLLKDSLLVNALTEPSATGGNATFQRPGTIATTSTAAGIPQGQFNNGGVPCAVTNDVVNPLGLTPFALPAVPAGGHDKRLYCLSDAPFGTSVIINTDSGWVITSPAGTVVRITDADYPQFTAPGICELDGTYYVMDQADGTIRGSALQDPTTWPALQFIGADASLGTGVAVSRHLNYIVAYYSAGIQLYYDAGQSPGIPIAAVGNASWTTGCASGDSIVEIMDLTLFVGQSLQAGKTVQQLSGLQMVQVSNPYIERILNLSNMTQVYSYGIKISGHTLYVLTLQDINVTLVYDTILQKWSTWSSNVSNVDQYFIGAFYLSGNGLDLLQNLLTGAVEQITPASFRDTSGVINVRIRTPNYDWGTLKRKRFAAAYILGDTVSTTLQVRYTDDDYQTYSAYRTVDLSTVRKMLQRCGSSRRRAWDFLHSDPTQPFRVYEMQLDMSVGSS